MKTLKLFSFLLLTVVITVNVGTQSPISEKPIVVFVHGFLADGSCWAYQISALQVKGCHVVSAQNPVTSLAEVN